MKTRNEKSQAASLREKAMEIHERKQAKSKHPFSDADTLKLIHELEVQQIELELQNEELLLARVAAKEASEKYTNLYDFAPVGYYTLNGKGEIIELNLIGAEMLGKERSRLKNNMFGFYVSKDTKPIFNQFLEDVFNTNAQESCEVTLANMVNSPLQVILSGIVDEKGEQCVVTVVEISRRKMLENALKERIKEMHCFFDIGEIYRSTEFRLEKLFLQTVNLLPQGWQYPEITRGKVRFDGKEYVSQAFKETKWKQSADIIVNGKVRGSIEVFYLDKCPELDEGPFMKEERDLITILTKTISEALERNLAMLTLRKSEDQYRALVEKGNIAIAIDDIHGNLIYFNKQFLDLFGYSAEEIENKTHKMFVHPDDIKIVSRYHKNRLQGKKTSSRYEFKGIRKGGSIIYIEIDVCEILMKEGESSGTRSYLWDITKRKLTELALIESKERFDLAMKATKDGVYDWNLLTNKIYYSPGWKSMLGYKEDELSNDLSAWETLTSPDDVKKTWPMLNELFSKERDRFETEFMMKHKDGHWVNVLSRAEAIFDASGKAVRIVGTHVDITERILAKEALENSEQKLRNIFENSTNLFYAHTVDHVLTYLSPQVENILGYTVEEALVKWTSLTSDNPLNELGFEFTKIAIESGKRQTPYELELVKKDGTKIWVEVREFPIVENGKTTAIVGSLTEITERKHTDLVQTALFNISNRAIRTDDLKQLIRFIKEELGAVIDTTNFYIALYDEKTDTLSLPFFADEKDNISSFPAGKTITSYIIKTQKSLLATHKEKLKLEQAGEIELFGSDSEVWLGVPLKIEGKIMGVVVVQSYTDENAFNTSDQKMLEFVSDQISISIDRKQAEENLLSALEKARESDRLKSAFLAAMSHELRTPLNAIIGFSEIINEDKPPLEEVFEFNETILSSGNHLLKIVEAIFDIALIESGETKSILEDVRLNIILNEVIEISKIEQEKANKNNLVFNLVNSLEEKDLLIKTDPSKLKQILINLLKNALKFTHSGEINFSCRIDKRGDRQVILFLIEDTGIGVPREKQDFVFDVFRQAEDSNTRKYGGVGLGLAIAKKLTLLLGGDIWLESEEGAGSKFYFTIPIEEEIKFNTIPILKEKKDSRLKGKTILVVEDVEYSFEFLQIVLEKPGVNTLWAKDGKEAIALCSENKDIDLVLMDINMPIMNGYDATREIRKTMPDLPIIAQTANAIAGDREKSLASGCNNYISKPIKKAELLALLGKYL